MRIGELHQISKVDFIKSSLSETVHRKVELSLIWAQVALCKLTMGADLTVACA